MTAKIIFQITYVSFCNINVDKILINANDSLVYTTRVISTTILFDLDEYLIFYIIVGCYIYQKVSNIKRILEILEKYGNAEKK